MIVIESTALGTTVEKARANARKMVAQALGYDIPENPPRTYGSYDNHEFKWGTVTPSLEYNLASGSPAVTYVEQPFTYTEF